jgi:hypothetical protein
MKKRKSPILIITAGIVFLCLAAFMSDQSRKISMTPEQMQKQAEDAQEKQMQNKQQVLPAGDKKAMSDKLQAMTKGGGAPDMEKMSAEMRKNMPAGMRDKLTVERPKMTPMKPKIEDSSIAGQWWNEEHARK